MAWLDRLVSGKVAAEIQLDLIEAAGQRSSPEIRERLDRYEASRSKDDPLARYREALAGGDARPRAGDLPVQGRGGVPPLSQGRRPGWPGIRRRGRARAHGRSVAGRTAQYLLESIVTPDRKIAQGFESVVLATSDGKVVTGVLRGEDDKQLRLITAEGHAPDRCRRKRSRTASAGPRPCRPISSSS